MHFPTSFYTILSRAPALTFSFSFFLRYMRKLKIDSGAGETRNFQQETYESKSWAFQKSRFYTLWCPYAPKKYLSDNKNKDPETFVPSTKEFKKNLFIHGAISYQVKSLKSHFESESKKATNLYRVVQWTKLYKIYRR